VKGQVMGAWRWCLLIRTAASFGKCSGVPLWCCWPGEDVTQAGSAIAMRSCEEGEVGKEDSAWTCGHESSRTEGRKLRAEGPMTLLTLQ
jgi:hypothetical protein